MKKLLTMFVLVTTMLSFAACSNDDDDPSIVGTWKATKFIEYTSPSDKKGTESKPSATESTIITFNSDGSYKSVYSDTDSPNDNETENGPYTLKDGKIYLNKDSADYRFSGDNTLVFTSYNAEYDKYPEDGYKFEVYLSRQ